MAVTAFLSHCLIVTIKALSYWKYIESRSTKETVSYQYTIKLKKCEIEQSHLLHLGLNNEMQFMSTSVST